MALIGRAELLRCFSGCGSFLSFPNEPHKILVIERFCEKGDSSGIECVLAHSRIVSSANEDDPCLGRISSEASLHFQTVHLRHPTATTNQEFLAVVRPATSQQGSNDAGALYTALFVRRFPCGRGREFLETRIVPERIKHRIEPEHCGSERDAHRK